MSGSIRPVGMAVGQFLRRRRPHRGDLNLERQVHARQRMIGIEGHVVALDRNHGDDRR